MTFYRGQKVTMVRDWPPLALIVLRGEAIPRYGEVYTVRAFYRHHNGAVGLYLAEIRNEPRHYACAFAEIAFAVEFFRPVVEPKLELPASITAFLDSKNHTPLPAREHEEAYI